MSVTMEHRTTRADLRIEPGGSVSIPAGIRAELGFDEGKLIVGYVEDGRLVLATRERIIADLQALFAHIPPDRSLVDELIAERREEARKEEEEDRRWERERRRRDGA